MNISLITPTHQQRETHLRRLYQVFKAQTYPQVELLILDDSPEPSAFYAALADDKVHYVHSPEPLTLGQKRNYLAEIAMGDIIMHFDDDDYYAPNYVERMLTHLGHQDFVTLSSWYSYIWGDRQFYYWDTEAIAAHHFQLQPDGQYHLIAMDDMSPDEQYDWMTNMLWGFGFSYVYRRSFWQQVQFNNTINACEDFYFVMEAINRGQGNLTYVADHEALVLHMIHPQNTSRIFPQYLLPIFLLPQLFGQGIVDYLSMDTDKMPAQLSLA